MLLGLNKATSSWKFKPVVRRCNRNRVLRVLDFMYNFSTYSSPMVPIWIVTVEIALITKTVGLAEL